MLNKINKDVMKLDDANLVSDGYHTFGELYEHRIKLFMLVVKMSPLYKAWRAKRSQEGDLWEGWFILGLNPKEGEQITYYLPIKYWETFSNIPTFDKNPYYDGHNSNDILDRLSALLMMPKQ